MAQINTGRPIAQFRKPVKDEAYRAWIRKQPCTTQRNPGCWRWDSEAAHTRQDGQGGLGTKTDDATCLPLCGWCHRLSPYSYHAFGDEQKWAEHHGVDVPEVRAELRRRYVGGDDD